MTQKQHYISGLDGLRAFAVLSVLAYHFGFSWARGGFLGVDIFFVLSGYLITSIVLPTQGHPIELNLREFWFKRIRRLLPAAYFMIICTFVWVMLFNRELLNTVRGDAISSIFYASNWWFIFHDFSYFDSFGSPSPLKNLWSLAIEEQFYILWPIVIMAGFYVFKKRSSFSVLVIIGIILSAVLMSFLYHPGTDPSRIYYGTDTRCFELLIGCFLAFIWPMKRLTSRQLSIKMKHSLNMTSFIALGIFILSIVFLDEFQPLLYKGGMLLFCVNAAILIACISHPVSILGKWLSLKALRWIGSRSYGIYLWHYPVIVLSTPVYEIGNPVYWRVGVQIILTFMIAEFSYRFIEMPIRKYGFASYFRDHLTINVFRWRGIPLVRKISTILLPLVLLVFITGITGVVKGDEQQDSMASSQEKIKYEVKSPSSSSSLMSPSEKSESPLIEKNPTDQNSGQEGVQEVEQNKETTQNEKTESDVTTAKRDYQKMLAIGDSVMLDIAESLHTQYPELTIDGKVGRQVSQAVEVAHNYTNFNQTENAIIIELGTNGFFTNDQIDALLQTFSKTQIYLVNTRVPRPWESKVNETLATKAKENANITLVDWYSEAKDHPEYFAPDGVHLVPKGIEALTSLIDQVIYSNTK